MHTHPKTLKLLTYSRSVQQTRRRNMHFVSIGYKSFEQSPSKLKQRVRKASYYQNLHALYPPAST